MPAAMNMIYCATTCAFWSAGATGVRHVFYRLFSISLGDREDAATNVCRRPAWRLRPAARFLDPAHRHNVLRAISPDAAKTCSGGAGEAYRSYSLTRYPASYALRQKYRYRSPRRRARGAGERDRGCGPQLLKPAVAAELHIKRGADGNYDADHEEIAVGPFELGYVLEIHPIDSGNGGRYGQDGGPRREPACNHILLRLPSH